MKRPATFAAIALTSICAYANAPFAADFADGQSQQKPGEISPKPPHHPIKQKVQELPPIAASCIDERSFSATGDSNSSFDPGIGCSTQSNLSAMTEDRGDLVKGRGTSYTDGERAGHVVSEYRAWKASPAPTQQSPKTTATQ
jgi:hypothetical protein